MKAIKVRYILKGRNFEASKRINKELVLAEISGGFCEMTNNKRKYSKFQLSLECSILPNNFGLAENNYKYDEVTFNKYSKSNRNVKTKIGLLQTALNDIESHYAIRNEQPTVKEFKAELLIKLKRTQRTIKENVYILSFLEQKIIEFKANINSNLKNEIDENTIKSYVTLSKYIVKYQTVRKTDLTFDNFDVNVYWDFWDVQDEILRGVISIPKVEGQRKQKIQSYGFLVNSVVKYQKTFKRVLAMAKKDKIEIAIDLTDNNLVLKETVNSKDIYINQNQLQKIIEYKPLSNDITDARDYTIIASLCGMRYESMNDAYGVAIEVFNESKYNFKYIHSRQNKTETECIIPLFKPVLDVIDAYKGEFPKFKDNATVNSNLKELFKLCGVKATATITYNTYKSGVIVENKTVNEIVSSHDLRKSFATNLFLMQVAQTQIDNVTHPDKKPVNAMANVYNKASMLDKAKMFVDEVNRVNQLKESNIYCF